MRGRLAGDRSAQGGRRVARRGGGPGRPLHPPDPLAAAMARRARHALPATGERSRPAAGPSSRSEPGGGPRRWRAFLLPLLTLVAVMAVEFSSREWTVIGYTVLVPLVAANLSGPRVTSVWAAAALGAGGLSVWWDRLYTDAHGGVPALVVRFAGITLGGVMAVLASRYNTGREAKLATITQVADVAQRAILSDVPKTSTTGLRFAVRYESAATEAMVGGDLYEMVDTPWGTRMLVGDARGKGLDAVLLASRVLGTFRVVAREQPGLVEILAALDAEVARCGGEDDFVTAVLVQLSEDEHGDDLVTLANAGHPDVLLLRHGQALPLTPGERQPPLGLGAGRGPSETMVTAAQPGDRLLLYTDGIAEAREPGSGGFFPLLPAAEHALAETSSLDDGLADLVTAVQRWTGGRLRDDVALLLVEIPAATRRCPTSGGHPASRPKDNEQGDPTMRSSEARHVGGPGRRGPRRSRMRDRRGNDPPGQTSGGGHPGSCPKGSEQGDPTVTSSSRASGSAR
jgi:serine phosphatase RsbU (regulator of sigma subunit)